MSQEKHFTAGRLAGWSVGIALLQFVVFFVAFEVRGSVEMAALVTAPTTLIIAFAISCNTAFALTSSTAAALSAMSAALFAASVASTVTSAAISGVSIMSAGAFATLAAIVAREEGARGNLASLFYIASPLGIALAIVAFAKTGSWGVALGILLADIVAKVVVARWAERKPATAAA